jgi:hypothetical protein
VEVVSGIGTLSSCLGNVSPHVGFVGLFIVRETHIAVYAENAILWFYGANGAIKLLYTNN